MDEFNWDRESIQLRTSVDTKDLFRYGQTEVTVINYGILWKWLESNHDWTNRYGGIILDEFADLTPQRELTVRMIFEEQKEIDESERANLVATSSSITPVYLKTVGNLYDGQFEFFPKLCLHLEGFLLVFNSNSPVDQDCPSPA